MLTKKDFIAIADAIRAKSPDNQPQRDGERYATYRRLGAYGQHTTLIAAVADVLRSTNPRFDRAYFIHYATYGPSAARPRAQKPRAKTYTAALYELHRAAKGGK